MTEQSLLPSPPQHEAAGGAAPLQVLWVGDATLAQRFVSRRAPHVHISAYDAPAALEFLRTLDSRGDSALDLIVLDATLPSVDPLQILGAAQSFGIDLPAVLLSDPGGHDVATEAGRLAVCDVVVKTQDFVHHLLPAFAQVRARHDLVTVLRSAQQREERLKAIIEIQPAVVCVIGADGKISAMNQAGLSLLGARADQVVGANFVTFLPGDERDAALSLTGRACAGQAGHLDHSLIQLGGPVRPVRTQAIPFPRVEGMVALATIHDRPDHQDASSHQELTAERDRLAAALREAIAASEALRAEGLAERAQCEKPAAEGSRLDQLLCDAAAERALMLFEHDRDRNHLTQALQSAGVHGETLIADQQRLEETAREALTRQAQDADAIHDLQAERDRLANALESGRARIEALAEASRRAEDGARDLQTRQEDSESTIAALLAERDGLTQAVQEARALSVAFDAERLAERAEWTCTTEAARAHHESAMVALDAERSQLADALLQAENSLAASRANVAPEPPPEQRAEDDTARVSIELELDAARARCQHLVEELTTVQAERREAEARADAAREEAAGVKARTDDMAERMGRALEADQRAIAELRRELTQFLCDADIRCKALAERRSGSRVELDAWRASGALVSTPAPSQ